MLQSVDVFCLCVGSVQMTTVVQSNVLHDHRKILWSVTQKQCELLSRGMCEKYLDQHMFVSLSMVVIIPQTTLAFEGFLLSF